MKERVDQAKISRLKSDVQLLRAIKEHLSRTKNRVVKLHDPELLDEFTRSLDEMMKVCDDEITIKVDTVREVTLAAHEPTSSAPTMYIPPLSNDSKRKPRSPTLSTEGLAAIAHDEVPEDAKDPES